MLRAHVEHVEHSLRRELRLFNLYRVLETTLLVLFLFGPAATAIDPPRNEALAKSLAVSYFLLSFLPFLFARRAKVQTVALIGIVFDLICGLLTIHAVPAAGNGIALMLTFNVGAAALLLPAWMGVSVAIAAVAGQLGEYVWDAVANGSTDRMVAEPVMFGIGYIAIATLMSVLGRQMRESYELAERHGTQAEHLSRVNELIIRRLRTGVLLVDGQGRLRLANEAASALLGDVSDGLEHGYRDLGVAIPELAERLARWRIDGRTDDTPLQVASDQPEVIPRFARLQTDSDQALIFLDDTSLLSQRAESITLATLGRFSASLAHEIRNPLAAISYAVQLLEESDDIPLADRRLLEIVRQQCHRMNGIVESVLGLARRDTAKPEHLELVAFVARFVDDYLTIHPLDQDTLQAKGNLPRLDALVDPRQLHQVLTALVSNALTYGRMPGEPARVSVLVSRDEHGVPTVEVRDRGPGIPEGVISRLFRPFFTTSSHGTGLGLYIARELCRANQATLDYVPVPAGGGCFRIRLTDSEND